MSTILSLQNITKYYGKLCALNNVSFEVPKGSVFGILGPNGSGKTTLLGTITDVLKPDAGTYLWFEQSPSNRLRKQIGTLLETPNFYPYLSAVDNLYMAATIKGCPRDDADRVLETVGLAARKNTLFRTYSLGMKQRLALASALLGNPAVILLDEPTNGLDPAGIADIRTLIRRMGEEGKTVIMASHLLDEVEKVCSHVAILKKGEILATGSVDEVLSSEERIEMASPAMDRLAQIMMAHPGVRSVKRSAETLQITTQDTLDTQALNEYCFAQGVVLSLLRKQKKSLEMKFMELTEGTDTEKN